MFVRNYATARIGEEILPFETEEVSEFFQKKAEVELHDTPERRAQSLRKIKEIAKKDKVTKDVVFSEEFLLQYLRCRKYNVTRAFSQLKSFVLLKKNHPDMFAGFKYENSVVSFTNKLITLLPWRCQDGCVIALVELGNWEPEEFPVEEIKKIAVLLLLQTTRNPMTQINGFKAIFDVQSNPLKHLRHATPQNLYLIYHGIYKCAPGRYKEVHIVNDSITFKTAWLFLKHFLPEKLRKRIFFHSSPTDLLNYFPRAVLPVQYGGDLVDYNMSHWLRKIMQPEELEIMVGGKYPQKSTS